MPSPIRNCPYPFTLSSNIVYFHDWRYVDHGNVSWSTEEGEFIAGLFSDKDLPPLRYDPVSLPTGISIVAQPATKSEPFLSAADDEMNFFGGTVIHEDGIYRLWLESWPVRHSHISKVGDCNLLRYFESDNGMDWRRPKLGLFEHGGSTDNNIVFWPVDPPRGYHGGGLFKDRHAGPAERYKLVYINALKGHEAERYRAEHPDAPQEEFNPEQRKNRVHQIRGAVSPDGLHWTRLPEALNHQISDNPNVCEWDPVMGKYVAYVRNWLFGRRGVGRIIADEFRNWPMSDDLFWPGPDMPPDATWYANGKTKMPGTNDYHIMFPMLWRFLDDKFEFHLAASPDNLTWSHVPGGAVCAVGEPGAWDGGAVVPGCGMVNLPGDRIGIPMAATPIPHKHPRTPPLGKVAWAWWPKGRLTALDAPALGSFSLWPLKVPQRNVHLNFRTAPAGRIEVEAWNWHDRKPIGGRRFEDCDRLVGDELDKRITWRGQADLGHDAGNAVVLRFRMRTANLFSVEFR